MATGRDNIRVAIVGLGRVGSVFLKSFIERDGIGVKIVACVEQDPTAQGVELAEVASIPVYGSISELLALDDRVDVIFDFTGSIAARRELRGGLAARGNTHTVIAPEVIAHLMWDLMGSTEPLPPVHKDRCY